MAKEEGSARNRKNKIKDKQRIKGIRETREILFFVLIFVFTIFFLINSNPVSAVGISGLSLSETFDFEPFLEETFYYRLGTNADHAMNYSIYVKNMGGGIAQYITTSASMVFLEVGQGYDFTATMKLPETLDPGLHSAHICVLETETRGGGGGANNIGVRTEVCAVINVRVLYPGKYLVIRNFDIIVTNKKVVFTIGVENWGTQTISSLQSIIDIYESNQTSKLRTVLSEKKSLESNAATNIVSTLDADDFSVGDYLAKATVVYDEQEERIEKEFKLGELTLNIINYTKEFEQDKISLMKLELESIWNQQIKDVYATINISQGGNSIQVIKTPPGNIEPWGRVELSGYFDTNEVTVGEYEAEFNIFYAGKITKDFGKINVREKERMPLAISTNTILLSAILILLIILILIVIRRKARE